MLHHWDLLQGALPWTGSGRRSKIAPEILEGVEAQMRLDDESSAYQLYALSKR